MTKSNDPAAVLPKLGNYPVGSVASRASARVLLDIKTREPDVVFRIIIVHVGHDGTTSLPPKRRVRWPDGIAEFVQASGSGR